MNNIQELIDSIYYDKTIHIKGEPLGKRTQVYPGATATDSPDYITHTSIDQYGSRLQQPIENEELNEQDTKTTTTSYETESDDEEEYDTSEIGRIYEMKKIFSRLISLESFLSSTNDDLLLKLASYVDDAINLFKLVVDNMDQFIEEIDDIIVSFYEFLDISYKLLKKHYDKLDYDEGDK